MNTETLTPPTIQAQKPGKRFYIDKDKKPVRFLTVDEWKQAARIEVSDRTYKRKKGKLERHRIVNMMPHFTGASGTDIGTIDDPEKPEKDLEVVHCVPRVMIEKFKIEEVKNGDQTRKVKVPLSSWLVDAFDFIEEYETYPETD